MKFYLSAVFNSERYLPIIQKTNERFYFLQSFAYYNKSLIEQALPFCKDMMFDSGGFTFIHNKHKRNIDWLEYTKSYIQAINEHDIKHFFELDIDNVLGYEQVLELRKILEKGTNKKCIPVFHKSRGLEEWIRMCNEYSYVAIGTGGDYSKNQDYKIVHKLCEIARTTNTKVHGLALGYKKYTQAGLYSVDSTTWNSSLQYGWLGWFNGNRLLQRKGQGRLSHNKYEALEFTLLEWLKYQKYLDMKGS